MFRSLRLGVSGSRTLQIRPIDNFGVQLGDGIASISIADAAADATSGNNLLAYRPDYPDFHGSNLGTIFLNLRGIFPCLDNTTAAPRAICSPGAWEEDGLNGGQSLVHAIDTGDRISVFGTDILTYAIAVRGCAQLNENCFPNSYVIAITCQLPRESCG